MRKSFILIVYLLVIGTSKLQLKASLEGKDDAKTPVSKGPPLVVAINPSGAALYCFSFSMLPESAMEGGGIGKNLWASREKIAKLYWLLRSFEVCYDFEIGPYRSQRQFTVENQNAMSSEPQQRVGFWPEFNLEKTRDPNPRIKVYYTVWTELTLSVEVTPGIYAVTLEVTERDLQSMFIFSTLREKDYPNHDCVCTFPFVFAEIETAVYIYIAKSVRKKWACRVNHFEIIPTFYTDNIIYLMPTFYKPNCVYPRISDSDRVKLEPAGSWLCHVKPQGLPTEGSFLSRIVEQAEWVQSLEKEYEIAEFAMPIEDIERHLEEGARTWINTMEVYNEDKHTTLKVYEIETEVQDLNPIDQKEGLLDLEKLPLQVSFGKSQIAAVSIREGKAGPPRSFVEDFVAITGRLTWEFARALCSPVDLVCSVHEMYAGTGTWAGIAVAAVPFVPGKVIQKAIPKTSKLFKRVEKGPKINKPLSVFAKETEWIAKVGSQQRYKVIQRNDINWSLTRTGGPSKYIGKTNIEAAKAGHAPQLSDGSFVTIHHLGQKSTGPLVEVSTRYHGVGKPGQNILHGTYGPNKAHPELPVDHGASWKQETKQYWKDRIEVQHGTK